MTAIIDWRELVLGSIREEFVSSCPFLLLVGEGTRLPPASPPPVDRFDEATSISPGTALAPSVSRHALVLAVHKVRDTFASMITVGRTSNNDIVLLDPQVSRFHAYFQTIEQGLELVDADSRYGTYVDGRKLEAKRGQLVAPHQTIRFGDQSLSLLTAEACWDLYHRAVRAGPKG